MITFTCVNAARSMALFASAQNNPVLLKAAIAYLEKHWSDDRAAMRFYTFIERTAEARDA